MKRQMRRSLRKFERKLSQAKSYFGRSNSEYQYTHRSTYVPSPVFEILLGLYIFMFLFSRFHQLKLIVMMIMYSEQLQTSKH
jgi:hypothetical protein